MILKTEIIDNIYFSFNAHKVNKTNKFNINLIIYCGSIKKNISASHKKICLHSSKLN